MLKGAEQLRLRNMDSKDLTQVCEIEKRAQQSPWSKSLFQESLSKQYRCRVVEYDGAIIAYHVVCAVVDELHILNIVVDPSCQGKVIGHVLLEDIIDIAEQEESNRIFLEVRSSNQIAQSLYQKWQFEPLSVRKGYYRTKEKQREDALVMVKNLN